MMVSRSSTVATCLILVLVAGCGGEGRHESLDRAAVDSAEPEISFAAESLDPRVAAAQTIPQERPAATLDEWFQQNGIEPDSTEVVAEAVLDSRVRAVAVWDSPGRSSRELLVLVLPGEDRGSVWQIDGRPAGYREVTLEFTGNEDRACYLTRDPSVVWPDVLRR